MTELLPEDAPSLAISLIEGDDFITDPEIADNVIFSGHETGIPADKPLVFGIEPLQQGAFARQQVRINSLAKIGASFSQCFQQATRPGSLAGLQGGDTMAFRRVKLIEAHKQVNVKVIILLHRGEVRSAHVETPDLGAE